MLHFKVHILGCNQMIAKADKVELSAKILSVFWGRKRSRINFFVVEIFFDYLSDLPLFVFKEGVRSEKSILFLCKKS